MGDEGQEMGAAVDLARACDLHQLVGGQDAVERQRVGIRAGAGLIGGIVHRCLTAYLRFLRAACEADIVRHQLCPPIAQRAGRRVGHLCGHISVTGLQAGVAGDLFAVVSLRGRAGSIRARCPCRRPRAALRCLRASGA